MLYPFFEKQVQKGIEQHNLLEKGEKVLVALSGGKDSLALALVLSRLGYDVTGLHIDLSIGISSEKARAVVERFAKTRHSLNHKRNGKRGARHSESQSPP